MLTKKKISLLLGILLVIVLPFGSSVLSNDNVVHAQGETPTLYVDINFEWVDGWYWPLGDDVTLTIMEPGNPTPVYEPQTKEVGWHDSVGGDTYVRFDLWENGFNVEPGYLITLVDEDTGVTKTHTALNIGITQVNVTDNTVTGFAKRNTNLVTSAHEPCWEDVEVTADGNDYKEDGYAYWQADFDGICELSTVEFVSAEQQGLEEGTSTGFFWEPPQVEVNIFSDYVVGHSWLPGTNVTLTIDGPDIQGTKNFTLINTVGADPESSPDTVQFDFLGDFFVEPGHIVTLSDGGVSVVYEVENLEVTSVDLDNNRVAGLADPGADLLVTFGDSGTEKVVNVDDTGTWSIDHEDLASETWGMVFTPAEYGNNTSSDWYGPVPATYHISPWWDEATVRTADTVFLLVPWRACTYGLVKAYRQVAHIEITLNGEILLADGESSMYWNTITPTEMDNCIVASSGGKASESVWIYPLDTLKPGIYKFHNWLDGFVPSGIDQDGDGKIDENPPALVESTVTIVVK